MMLVSILFGIAMWILIGLEAFFLEKGFYEDRYGNAIGKVTSFGLVVGFFLGVLTWGTYYFAQVRKVAISGIVIVAVLTIVMVLWSYYETSRWWELLVFIGILVILWFVAHRVISTLTTNIVWTLVVPTIVFIVAAAIITIKYFLYHYLGLHLIDPIYRIGYLFAAGVTAFVAIILIVCLLVGYMPKAKARSSVAAPDAVVEVEETTQKDNTKPQVWYKFQNSKLLEDKDKSNDYNFGPDPTKEGWTVTEYEKEFRERVKLDPALAAADMAWLDANVGTRYLGEFYESCKGDWAKTMNLTKEKFMKDQTLHNDTVKAFFEFLDSATKVEVRKCQSVSDQMFMNPFTVDKVPDIIVMLTNDHTGYELVYTFVIKDNVFEVAYRINCGYQPTDVAEIMNITPTNPPEEPPTQPPTEPPTEPETKYNKDPEKAPKKNTEPNDDPGPGPDTNNGKGAKESTKDQPTNSNHYSSYEEYSEAINDLEEINKNQKTGGDPNTPSTPKPTNNTKVDNNGDNGTGNGGIDTPTPIKPPAKTEDGQEINTEPAGSWGGPED